MSDTTGDTTGWALATYELRRVVQTRRAFANWPALLRQMAAEKLGRKGGTLEFVTRTGLRLQGPNVPGARLPLYEQYADDSYRLGEVLAPFAGRPLQVLDVGAHIGAFALNVLASHPQSRVDCYEPSPRSAAYLRRNIADNGFDARATVHEMALADSEGTAHLDDNDSASVHNGLIRANARMVEGHDALATRHAIEVPTTTFDKAVAAAAPQLVKMDCEGGEYPLVYASAPESWAGVERVVMEYHPVAGESWPQLRGWLADVGLHVVREKSERPGLGTAWLARSGT